MMKLSISLVMLVMGIAIAARSESTNNDERVLNQAYNNVVADIQTDGLVAVAMLEALRAGAISNVLENLELKVDLAVITAWQTWNRGESTQRDEARATLLEIKTYRLKNPRKVEAILSPGKFEEARQDIIAKSSEILKNDEWSRKPSEAQQSAPPVSGTRGTSPAGAGAAPQVPNGEP